MGEFVLPDIILKSCHHLNSMINRNRQKEEWNKQNSKSVGI